MFRFLVILTLLIPSETAFAQGTWLERLFSPSPSPSGRTRHRAVRLPAVAPLPLPRPDRADRGSETAKAAYENAKPVVEPVSNPSEPLELSKPPEPTEPARADETPAEPALASTARAGAGAEVGAGRQVRADFEVVPSPDPIPVPLPRPEQVEPINSPDRVAIAISPLPGNAVSTPRESPGSDGGAPDGGAPDDNAAGDKADSPAPSLGPSACRARLTPDVARAPSAPDINGPGACGAHDMVRLEAVVLPDKSEIKVRPAAIIRCSMAESIARWVRDDVVPAAAGIGATVKTLENYASYDCRGRNNIPGAKLSEHGKGNALDVRAFRLSNRKLLEPTDSGVDKTLREALRKSACARFTTVLGPGSDGYHENHIHIDLAKRRNGYRLCQWDIREPGPASAEVVSAIGGKSAVPLPLPRPKRDGDAPASPSGKSRL